MYLSLKAKLKAYVGIYLIQFAKFPFHKVFTPSSFITLLKQFPMEVYLTLICGLLSYVYIISLTLSIGAIVVLETTAATPAAVKSRMKLPDFLPILSKKIFVNLN